MTNVVLISTYELGRQPFGLASPAAWLREAGASVTCLDLAVQQLEEKPVTADDLVGFYVPMLTATRVAMAVVERVKRINPGAHLCFYGLYAPVNEELLRTLGAGTILGGEFEEGLVALVKRLSAGQNGAGISPQVEPVLSLAKQKFLVPDRTGLPQLQQYAFLTRGDGRQQPVGYTEASRGCKHLCRHCPVVPVYGGRFRVVQPDVVLEDIGRQVEAGAEHITFGDPDFFNGPGHAVAIVEALHRRWPKLTYDVTIKIEHLLDLAHHLPLLGDTGCLFVTSAVEAVHDHILEIFDKRHTRADFIQIVSLFREVGLTLHPTFVTFTPWTALDAYLDLLRLIHELELVENVSPIQYAIRLLIPAGSRLLELPEARTLVGEFDERALSYPWVHPDPRMDRLHGDLLQLVQESQDKNEPRHVTFGKVWEMALAAQESTSNGSRKLFALNGALPQKPVPFLSEPWYC